MSGCCRRHRGKISAYKVSRSEVSKQDLCKTSLCKRTFDKISTDVHARCLRKISTKGLLATNISVLSVQAHLPTRSLHKLSIQDFLVKISAQDFLDRQNEHRATVIARAISQFEPRQNESGYDAHKVTKGLHEDMLDFHKTLCASRKNKIEQVKNDVFLGLCHFFVEVYKALRLPQKMSPRHLKSGACHTEPSSCPKSNSTTA